MNDDPESRLLPFKCLQKQLRFSAVRAATANEDFNIGRLHSRFTAFIRQQDACLSKGHRVQGKSRYQLIFYREKVLAKSEQRARKFLPLTTMMAQLPDIKKVDYGKPV